MGKKEENAAMAKAPAEAGKKEESAAMAKTPAEAEKRNENVNILEKVGKAAIKEHDLKQVYVANDGTVFRTESDAKNYAANLKIKTILTVKK